MACNQNLDGNLFPCKRTRVEEVPESTPLHDAAQNGATKVVEQLLKKGTDINRKIKYGLTPLHVAVRGRALDCFNLLLDWGADVNVADDGGRLPLHYAAMNGELLILKRLLTFEFALNAQDKKMRSPLQLAIKYGNLDCAEELLNEGANTNTRDYYGRTPLHVAIIYGYGSFLRKLFAVNADVNIQDIIGLTPLHMAVVKGNLDCVEALLNSGADVDLEDDDKHSPIHLAAESDDWVIWKKLLDRKPKALMNEKGQFTLAESVLFGNSPEFLDDLFKAGVDVHLKEKERNRTLLHLAAQCDSELPLMKLLESNVDVNEQDNNGFTPLHLACQDQRLDIILLLLDAGARWDIPDNRQRTMLCDLLYSVSTLNIFPDKAIPLFRTILERTNDGSPIHRDTKRTAAHYILELTFGRRVDFFIELIKIVLSTQNSLDMVDCKGCNIVYYITRNLETLGINAVPLLRICIERRAYLDCRDCDRIGSYPEIRDGLLHDIEFCMQSIVNQFNNYTLVKIYEHLNNIWSVPIESFKIIPIKGSWRIIEQDVRSQIERQGYCNVSQLVITSLSKLCIEALYKKFCSGTNQFNS